MIIINAEENRAPLKRTSKKNAKKIGETAEKKADLSSLKQRQLNSLKQGLKEAILTERGELERNPISTLWDE
jgi:hypothetical protein